MIRVLSYGLTLILTCTCFSSEGFAQAPPVIDVDKPLFRILYIGEHEAQLDAPSLVDAVDWVERSISWSWQQLRKAAIAKGKSVGDVVKVDKIAPGRFLEQLIAASDNIDFAQVDLVVLDPTAAQWHSFLENKDASFARSSWIRHPSNYGNEHHTDFSPPPMSARVRRLFSVLDRFAQLELHHAVDVVFIARSGMSTKILERALPDMRVLQLRDSAPLSQDEVSTEVPIKVSTNAQVDDKSSNSFPSSTLTDEIPHVISTLEEMLDSYVQRRLTEVPVNDVFDVLPIDVRPQYKGDDVNRKAQLAKMKTRAVRTARYPLSNAQLAEGYAAASVALGTWRLRLWDRFIDGRDLKAIAECPEGQPFVRHAREVLQRPVDVRDFLLLLDDILLAGQGMLRGRRVHLPPSRLRGSGAFLHPHDVFRKKFRKRPYRIYPAKYDTLWIAPGKSVDVNERARNGAPLGPPWYRRYPNPGSERSRLKALKAKNPDFAARLSSLMSQLRKQKVRYSLDSTVRKQQRGYLMYGAFWLSQATTEEEVNKRIRVLRRLNRKWKLKVRIQWRHPLGWQATVDAAREMKDTYGVVYATVRGAEKSDHYDGNAVDISVPHLPRRFRLKAPDGEVRTFRLHRANEPRDLSLSPHIVEWIEAHFALLKLQGDYPHWSDAAAE